MTSPYSSHSSSLANLSHAVSLSTPPSVVIPQRNVPAGTLPPGTHVTVGKHTVTIERWLSEGIAFVRMLLMCRWICACLCCAIEGENETCGWKFWRRGLFKESYRS
jgi:hypothetical protein